MFTDNLQPFLQEAWKSAQFTAPLPIQEQTFNAIYDGRDIVAVSPTGSGKTVAYLIPLLEKIDPTIKQAQVLILASSQELAAQIHQVVRQWTVGSAINSIMLIGGANIKRQIEKLKKKPQIVVGTPGRILELIKQKKFKVHELNGIVLDEADQLLVPEHRNDLFGIIKATPNERQLLLFSATIDEALAEESQRFMDKPEVIRIDQEEAGTPHVSYEYLRCEERKKIDVLRSLARHSEEQMLVFFDNIGDLNVTAEKLTYMGISVEPLHGEVGKQQRERAIRLFSKGEVQLLLATDVAARGLDVKGLSSVIQMDVPREADSYLHRAGRTGRVGSTGGMVLSLVTDAELKKLHQLTDTLAIDVQEKVLQKGKLVDK
ncbi:DEAD/DEAH box helicase [Paraliobacillus ryukyuensis]|uniref:DEAD/DEAH box helicase n=1 Tax=Paraliobacillus ryukyuensis TaxID=200904 RepID=UPI0009A746E8|nr:DEAD/DEAH box helicase [Paraliobacillus ryukyuensis]